MYERTQTRGWVSAPTPKWRLLLGIIGCFAMPFAVGGAAEAAAAALGIDNLWVGVVIYAVGAALVLLYVAKVERRPLHSIGLHKPVLGDLPVGLLLGAGMFVLQIIPLVAMGVDFRAYTLPEPRRIVVMCLYMLVCVGSSEEIVFRGFLLHRARELFGSRVVAVILNCLLFYAFHWPPVRFVPGEFYNTTANTLVLCVYLLLSRRKSLVPLILAHGMYDIFISYLPPLLGMLGR